MGLVLSRSGISKCSGYVLSAVFWELSVTIDKVSTVWWGEGEGGVLMK